MMKHVDDNDFEWDDKIDDKYDDDNFKNAHKNATLLL